MCTIIAVWLSRSRSPSDTGFPVYATRIKTNDALKGFTSYQYKHWKWGTLLLYSHSENFVRIAFCVLWCTWGEALLDFHHENKKICYRIFAIEIWHQFQTHWESIDWDHTHSKIKPQSPTHLKLHKLMPIAYFQLPMSKNYGFTKTKDCPWTGAMGCLTPSLYITRLPNSRIKIFYPSILD